MLLLNQSQQLAAGQKNSHKEERSCSALFEKIRSLSIFFFRAGAGITILCIFSTSLIAVDETDQVERLSHALTIVPRLAPSPTRKDLKVSCVSAAEYYPLFHFDKKRAVLVKLEAERMIVNDFACNFLPYTVSLRTYKCGDAREVKVFSAGAVYGAKAVRYLPKDLQLKTEIEGKVIDAFIQGKSYSYYKSKHDMESKDREILLDPTILDLGYKKSDNGQRIGELIRDISAYEMQCPKSMTEKNKIALNIDKKTQWRPVIEVLLKEKADVLSLHGCCLEDLEAVQSLLKASNHDSHLKIAHCKGKFLTSFQEIKEFIANKKKENHKQKKQEAYAFYISDAWVTLPRHCSKHGLMTFKTKYIASTAPACGAVDSRKDVEGTKTASPVALIVNEASLAFIAASTPVGLQSEDQSRAIGAHLTQTRDLRNTIIKGVSYPVIYEFCNVSKDDEELCAKRLGREVPAAEDVQLYPVTLIRDENREDGADSWLEAEFYKKMVKQKKEEAGAPTSAVSPAGSEPVVPLNDEEDTKRPISQEKYPVPSEQETGE